MYNQYVNLSDSEEMMMCGKCGEVEVTVSQKYCEACQQIINSQTPQKNYSIASELEQYIIFNSVARKIKLIIGGTEYYTEDDFPFANEWEQQLIGTIKFEGEFTTLLKQLEEYNITDGEDFQVYEKLHYADGVFNPETGEFDKSQGGQTLIGKSVKGYKYSGNTLITSVYTIGYDLYFGEETKSDVIYTSYTLDGDNFYYEEYKMEDGQKVITDMFDIVKPASEQTELEDVYYVQMMLSLEEITGSPAVYFEEANDIAEQWEKYVSQKMNAELDEELPTKVYTTARIKTIDNYYEYQMYYFRDYDWATAGYESSLVVYPDSDGYYVYVRGLSAPTPESWKNGVEGNYLSGEKMEAMIMSSLYEEYGEALVVLANGQGESRLEGTKYQPFALKEYVTTMDVNDNYQIIYSYAEGVEYTFTSTNEDVATVDQNGYITSGGLEGDAIIIVQRGKLVRYFYVHVRATVVNNSPEEMVIQLGTRQHAVFNVYSNQGFQIEFSSDDEEVVTIDDSGYITAVGEGATAVKATISTGKTVQMIVYVVKKIEFEHIAITNEEDPYISESVGTWASIHGSTAKTIISYDISLYANQTYTFKFFDGLDINTEEINGYFGNGQQVGVIHVNGEPFNENVTIEHPYIPGTSSLFANIRNFTFNESGSYKISIVYTTLGGKYYEVAEGENLEQSINPIEVTLIEINVNVDKILTWRYDQSTNTYYVKDYEGLLVWREALLLDPNVNLTLEADIYMPTDDFLFDEDKDNVYDDNWSSKDLIANCVIDGQNHTIYNIRISAYVNASFVNELKNGAIKDLTMADGIIEGRSTAGFVIYSKNSLIMNCINYNKISSQNYEGYVAGIVCTAEDRTKIISCSNYGDIENRDTKVAGIVAFLDVPPYYSVEANGVLIIGCANYGTITAGFKDNYANGVIGCTNDAEIYACFNSGEIIIANPNVAVAYIRSGYGLYLKNSGVVASENNYTTTGRATLNRGDYMIDGETITLEYAVEQMNATIDSYNETAEIKVNYKYVINTDPNTSEKAPVILQKVIE